MKHIVLVLYEDGAECRRLQKKDNDSELLLT